MTQTYKSKIDHEIVEKVCSDCGIIANIPDHLEWHGFKHFNFGIEYVSLFDSDMHYELDLCRYCATELFKKLLKNVRRQVLKESAKRTACDCVSPILLGHEDCESIPKGYARCQECRLFIKI
ncbi:MAG: hypothetical protein KJ971_08655 [Firmicutes bacterium]|nr:hypothetical protein [Bacillota bacterium]